MLRTSSSTELEISRAPSDKEFSAFSGEGEEEGEEYEEGEDKEYEEESDESEDDDEEGQEKMKPIFRRKKLWIVLVIVILLLILIIVLATLLAPARHCCQPSPHCLLTLPSSLSSSSPSHLSPAQHATSLAPYCGSGLRVAAGQYFVEGLGSQPFPCPAPTWPLLESGQPKPSPSYWSQGLSLALCQAATQASNFEGQAGRSQTYFRLKTNTQRDNSSLWRPGLLTYLGQGYVQLDWWADPGPTQPCDPTQPPPGQPAGSLNSSTGFLNLVLFSAFNDSVLLRLTAKTYTTGRLTYAPTGANPTLDSEMEQFAEDLCSACLEADFEGYCRPGPDCLDEEEKRRSLGNYEEMEACEESSA